MHPKLRKHRNCQVSIFDCGPAECAERLNRAPRWRQPAGRPLESTFPTSKPFSPLLELTPLRSRIGGPRIPAGLLLYCPPPYFFILRFFHLSLRCSMSQRLGTTWENLDAGEIFTLRLPLSECDACGLLRAPHSTRQAPTKSSKSLQGCHENENRKASKKNRNLLWPQLSHICPRT